jgi:DNA transformation protein
MAVSESFLNFVLEQLEGIRAISSRRMFGGAGIYSGDHFFAIIAGDRLYLKVDDRTRAQYVRAAMGPFQPFPDRPSMMKYYEVPVHVLEDREELARWAKRAIDVAGAPKRKVRKST